MIRLLTACLLVAACDSKDPEPKVPASEDVVRLYNEAADRLPRFLEDGQVVSRHAGGEPEGRGDSMLWTGLAIGSLDCARGAPLTERLLRRIEESDGELVRYEPFDESVAQNKYSWDGEVGLTYAFARRAARCGEEQASLASAWQTRQAAIARWGGRLHPESDQKVPLHFEFVTDAVAHKLGLRGAPHDDRQRLFELEAVAWAAGVVAAKRECYRVHLAFRSLLTVEAAGRDIGGWARSRFCQVTRDAGIPNVDRWCGRTDDFLATWTWDAWDFRHQKCGYQGGPDGTPGLETPAVDLLDYVSTFYDL